MAGDRDLAGNYLTLILINLAISFAPGTSISIGGHVGGLIGGIAGTAIIVARGRFVPSSTGRRCSALVAVGAASVGSPT